MVCQKVWAKGFTQMNPLPCYFTFLIGTYAIDHPFGYCSMRWFLILDFQSIKLFQVGITVHIDAKIFNDTGSDPIYPTMKM